MPPEDQLEQNMSNEDLAAAAKQISSHRLQQHQDSAKSLPSRVTDFLDDIVDTAEGISESVGVGLGEGIKSAGENTVLFASEMLNKIGAVSDAGVKSFKGTIDQRRASRDELIKGQDFPTVAGVSKTAGEIGAEVVGAGKLLKPLRATLGAVGGVAAEGAVLGAISNEQSRAGGALTGAALGGALGTAGKGIKAAHNKLRPERINEDIFARTGVAPTRAQILGRETEKVATDRVAKAEIQKLLPAKDVGTYGEQFKKLLQDREVKIGKSVNKIFDKAFQGKASTQKFSFDNVKESYKKIRPSFEIDSDPVVKRAMATLDDAFSKDLTLKEAKDLIVGNGPISEAVNSLFRGNAAALGKSAGAIKKELRHAMEDQLQKINPKQHKRFLKGMETAKRKITEVETKEITKNIKQGNFDTITSQLSSANGGAVLKKIDNALGPKARDIVEKGIVANSFRKAFDNVDSFSSAKFLGAINKVRKSSGFKFNKETSTVVNNLNVVMRTIKEAPRPRGSALEALPIIGEPIKKGISNLLDSKLGVKLFTRAKLKGPNDPNARRLIDDIIGTTNVLANQEKAQDESINPDNMSPEDLEGFAQQIIRQRGSR